MLREHDFLLRLSLCRGLGRVAKYRLWCCAHQLHCYDDLPRLIEQCQLTLRAQTALLNNWASPELDRAVNLNQGYPHITIVDPEYPAVLREIFCPPLVLFYAGNLTLLQRPCLGVVGARDASSYGAGVLRGFIPEIVKHQLVVVSGLARGIDGLSHQITLEHGGMTIGIIGCGLDRYYPAENRWLQQAVAKRGLVLSEYGRGELPLAYRFPERNRLIAGLVQTLLVVEAKRRSGSLITANIALDENRNVCAVPGRIDTIRSLGCNELIAAGAKPILRAQDLIDEFS
ncbi:MAG: DNA-processing protein DprA [Lactobacillaceae bacterium]|uniref:DNA-processing protein DprA n=1 Tax=Limosilactobacillus sp. TaxID=2773925 RepID=UPI002A75E983|nr:DNA-processing protein DprA [Limosilactobacillus sp.]MDD7693153.1 DNA-processing protein DprA [Lactobacillaceae bacterium]MDY2802763.1 DNA-processing protein DprA [Limosilactobacillus sp.]